MIVCVGQQFINESTLPNNVQFIANIHTTSLAALVNRNNPLSHNSTISLTRLLNEPLIFYDSYETLNDNVIFRFLSKYKSIEPLYVLNNYSTFLSVLKNKNCVALTTIDSKHDNDLILIPIREHVPISYNFLYNADEHLLPVILYFVEEFKKLLIVSKI